nr:MAG TPA: hypothetical protein [Caudoviricetes sp.]
MQNARPMRAVRFLFARAAQRRAGRFRPFRYLS